MEEEEEPEDRKKQRFKMYDTGLRNCMFIEMRVDKGQPGPCEVRAVLCRMCSWSTFIQVQKLESTPLVHANLLIRGETLPCTRSLWSQFCFHSIRRFQLSRDGINTNSV